MWHCQTRSSYAGRSPGSRSIARSQHRVRGRRPRSAKPRRRTRANRSACGRRLLADQHDPQLRPHLPQLGARAGSPLSAPVSAGSSTAVGFFAARRACRSSVARRCTRPSRTCGTGRPRWPRTPSRRRHDRAVPSARPWPHQPVRRNHNVHLSLISRPSSLSYRTYTRHGCLPVHVRPDRGELALGARKYGPSCMQNRTVARVSPCQLRKSGLEPIFRKQSARLRPRSPRRGRRKGKIRGCAGRAVEVGSDSKPSPAVRSPPDGPATTPPTLPRGIRHGQGPHLDRHLGVPVQPGAADQRLPRDPAQAAGPRATTAWSWAASARTRARRRTRPRRAGRSSRRRSPTTACALSGIAVDLWAFKTPGTSIMDENPAAYLTAFLGWCAFASDLDVKTIRVDTVDRAELTSRPMPRGRRSAPRRGWSGSSAVWDKASKIAADYGMNICWEFEPGFAFNKPSEIVQAGGRGAGEGEHQLRRALRHLPRPHVRGGRREPDRHEGDAARRRTGTAREAEGEDHPRPPDRLGRHA